jgi:hypothetical protein
MTVSAYSPDLPGCVVTGATREEVEKKMREAIEFHLEGLRLEGETIPAPRSEATLWHWRILLFWRPGVRPAGFSF